MSKGFIPPKFIVPAPPSFPPRKPRGRFSPLAITLAVGLVASVAIAAFFIFPRSTDELRTTAHNVPSTNPTTTTTASASTAPASVPQTSPAVVSLADSPETTAQLQKLFNEFAVGVRVKDTEVMKKFFDGPRMIELVHDMGLLSRADPQQRVQAGIMCSKSSARVFAKATIHTFEEITIYNVFQLPDPDEVLVLTHNRVLNPTSRTKSRWWLRKSGEVWRIYDVEQLDGSFRNSQLLATMPSLHELPGESPLPWKRYIDAFVSYHVAVYRVERPQQIGNGDFDLSTFPRPLQAAMLLIQGENEWMQHRPAKALQFYDQAEAMGLDTPRIHKVRAAAYLQNNQFDLAIASARRYMDLAGEDALACAYLADACMRLGRTSDAVAACQLGLRDDPQNEKLKTALRRLLQQ